MKRLLAALTLTAAVVVALAPASALPAAAAVGIGPVAFHAAATTLHAAGTLTGLDPALAYQANLTGAGLAQVGCHLPNGRTAVGEPVFVSVGARSDHLPAGTTAFALATLAPVLPAAALDGCPPQTRSASVVAVDWHGAHVVVWQGSAVVAEQSYAL